MMNCIIIDDEPLAREGLADYVQDMDFLQLKGSCENPVQLIEILKSTPVDLIFLDIQMPKMTGIDFLKIFKSPPIVIITTAFPNFAVESFQLNVLDYLLKPITFERFVQAVNKARDYHHLLMQNAQPKGEASTEAAGYFFIKCGTKYEKVSYADILYVEGMQNYVHVYTTKGKYTTMMTMKNMEELLGTDAFIRVHKSYVVAINKVDAQEAGDLFIGNTKVPIGRNYREDVIHRVVTQRLWDKVADKIRDTGHQA